jgi:endonuclease/exonuclease/phosphatase family metal-dependent hydrolase
MKVLSYNTLFAGFDGADRYRYESQIALIQALRPDVLLLQEVRDYTVGGGARWFETERQLGMRGFVGLAPQTGQNTAIFIAPSIRPVRVETDSAHFHHALLVLTAEVPGFPQPVTFISAHLCPNGAQVRTREAAYLIPHATAGALTLVGGDFNTISAHDGTPVDLAELAAHHRVRYTEPDGITPDSRPLQWLESAGLHDVGHHAGQSADATVPTAGFRDTEFASSRSDYFFASAALLQSLQDYRVIKNEITHSASDHYPIWVEFAPEPGQ